MDRDRIIQVAINAGLLVKVDDTQPLFAFAHGLVSDITIDEWLAMCPVPLACGATECYAQIIGDQLVDVFPYSLEEHGFPQPVTAIIVERKERGDGEG